jgi:hypothetical protein
MNSIQRKKEKIERKRKREKISPIITKKESHLKVRADFVLSEI